MICPFFHSKAYRIKLRPDIYEVSRRLAGRGHKIVVLTSKTYGAPDYEVVDGIEIYRAWAIPLPRIYYFIPMIPKFTAILFALCRKYTIEVIHFWNYEYLTSVLALLWRMKLKDVAFVLTIIGFPGLNWKYGVKIIDMLGLIYTCTLGKLILKAVDHVVLLGKSLEKYALWMGVPAKNISVNSFGVDFREFLPRKTADEVRRKLGIWPTEKVVIFIGRLEPIKGVKYLLEAARDICAKMDNIKFLLVGDGPLRSKLQASSNPQIIFTGWRDDVPDLLNASDLMVLPSLSEGLPLSILEAFAIEKPVVATNVGAVSEVVLNERNGLLVPPRDSTRLAEAISRLIRNSDLMLKMGKHGKDLIKEKYNWDDILEMYEEIYARALKKSDTVNDA
jgi:glycosyltransferase involved in cell wall biosynthesis